MTPDQATQTHSQHVLAVHSGALGDVVLFGRILEALRTDVTLVAGREKAQLLHGLMVADDTRDFELMPMQELFTDEPLEDCRLPKLLGQTDRLISCFAAGNRLAEMRLAAACNARSAAFLPIRPDPDSSAHLVELWADMLGIPLDIGKLRAWTVPHTWRAGAAARLEKAGVDPSKPYAIIQPGSGSPSKCWPLERFLELATSLSEQTQVVFLFGPVEGEQWPKETLRLVSSSYTCLANVPLHAVTGILAGAALYVGNDSGVTHVSGAIGTPTVAIFGSSNPRHFAPLGPRVQLVIGRSMDEVPVDAVLEGAREANPS
ncbi:MAG: glycosyltransferase family 9 protein [Phycisphaerae bacterium]